MSTASGKRKAQQQQAGFRLLIILAILICVNLLASRFHYGLDLTREKRFTLSEPTKKLLRNMDDVAIIEVYLEGKNHPPEIQRLKDAVRERLESFKSIAGARLKYRFVDPFAGKADAELETMFRDYAQRGMAPVNIGKNEGERAVTQLLVPYALVKYKGVEMPVPLTEYYIGMTDGERATYAESLLEYKFATVLNRAGRADKPRVAYVAGNGEALGYHSYDAILSMASQYNLDTIDLDGTNIPMVYSAVVICKPTVPFTDKQKFILDQYIMKGGNVLMMVDGAQASVDSFRMSEQFLAPESGLNLDDALFTYGVRINNNLIADLRSAKIGLQEKQSNGQYANVAKPWFYFPIFVSTSQHPIVKNMDAIISRFVSSLDTIGAPGIKKTVLLESSEYSRPEPTPVRVSLSMTRFPPKQELYSKGFQPAAVLLEGKFNSLFRNRVSSEMKLALDSLKMPFVPEGQKPSKLIVVGDGDIALNEVSERSGPAEMGFSNVDRVRFANKSFFLNCMEYLTDSSGLLEARNKDVRVRLLDGGRVVKEKSKWQLINIIIPIGFVLVFASCYIFFRKRRYEGVK